MKITLLDIISLVIVILIGVWSWQCVLGMVIGVLLIAVNITDDTYQDRDKHHDKDNNN